METKDAAKTRAEKLYNEFQLGNAEKSGAVVSGTADEEGEMSAGEAIGSAVQAAKEPVQIAYNKLGGEGEAVRSPLQTISELGEPPTEGEKFGDAAPTNNLVGSGPLSWAGGSHRVSGTLSGDPAVASALGNVQSMPVTPPTDFGGRSPAAPRCTESHSGKHQNGSDIFGG